MAQIINLQFLNLIDPEHTRINAHLSDYFNRWLEAEALPDELLRPMVRI